MIFLPIRDGLSNVDNDKIALDYRSILNDLKIAIQRMSIEGGRVLNETCTPFELINGP